MSSLPSPCERLSTDKHVSPCRSACRCASSLFFRPVSQVAPSTIFACASILEGAAYINGSPQNTFVPGVIEMAERHNVMIGGDDFKSGQTKMKSVMVDFLVTIGLGLGSGATKLLTY